MGALHADRRYRSQLSRANGRVEISLSPAHCLPGRAARRNEFVQEPAGALGEGSDSNGHQAFAPHHEEQAPLEDQGRGVFPFDRQHLLSVDDRALFPAVAGHDREIQPGLVSDALHRPAALAGIYSFAVDVLSDLAEGTVSGLAGPPRIPPGPAYAW